MPGKFDKNKYDVEYQRDTYMRILLRIRKDSEEWDALEECKAHTGIPYATYAHTALMEKLQRDGYLEK